MNESLEERIETLEKEVAALKVEVLEQPEKTRIYIRNLRIKESEEANEAYRISLLKPSIDS